jgi:tetratricopeptide (TPR) repeat protein
MNRMKLGLLAAVLSGAGLAAADEPPYRRLLQGEAAKKAEALEKRIEEGWAAGKFAEAVAPAEEVLALRRRLQGEDHWQTADATRLLATLRQAAALPAAKRAALAEIADLVARADALDNAGKYRESEPLYRKTLATCDDILGPRHPKTAEARNNLAFNLDAQGRAPEAEPLHRQTLAVYEAVLGSRHPETATSCNNLAMNLQNQGQVREAEVLFRKALAVCEETLGPGDPDIVPNYGNLAANLQAQGRARDAEPLFRKALAVREQLLGPRDAKTATSFSNLATNLHVQGRIREAEELFRKALAVQEEVLGPRHEDTALTYSNLAFTLQSEGRAREAEPLFRKALAIREEVLRPQHPQTLWSYNSLAYNLDVQGRPQEAEPFHRKALAGREKVLGIHHPDTAQSYHNLAANLQNQGKAKEAELLYRKALAIHEEVLGGRHPHTATSYASLAANLQLQGRAAEAVALWQAGADGIEAARLRLAASALGKATAVHIQPHVGLAACRARLGQPRAAWRAAEAGLARGLLDDLAARTALPADAQADRRAAERAARLNALDNFLMPLLIRDNLDDAKRRRRDDLLKERAALDDEAARAAAEVSARAVLLLDTVQAQLAADAALVFWVDLAKGNDHWGCVVRRSGPPAWVRLAGSGPGGAWTREDDRLPALFREDITHTEGEIYNHIRRLARQRLEPLLPHLSATAELPEVRRLIILPAGRMAGIPIEALTDRYLVSYAPSGTVFVRLKAKHRPLQAPTLLALGDPNFALPGTLPPRPPEYGLYLTLVLPDGNAARAGLRTGDVLLSYNGSKITIKEDLKISAGDERVPVVVWRDGKTLDDLRLFPGKLGAEMSDDPPAVVLRKRREVELVADARSRSEVRPLPATRLEVAALAALLPRDRTTLLLGSAASEQRLGELAAAGKLKDFRILHFATHGTVDPTSAAHSALELARDGLPALAEQERLRAAGKKVRTGKLFVDTIANDWELDADLVVLSACETGLGPDGGGEGLLGFSQVLLGKGARSLVLSLWKVDDTATALLMTRFYQNLLGKRDGLDKALLKAEALQEAKRWLKELSRAEVEKLGGELVRREGRGAEEPKGPPAPRESLPAGAAPFAHPRYWAAFILIGDPE